MSAKERREHLERAVAEGGTIMTAKGGFTRRVPSTTALARTGEEKLAAREDIRRRAKALEEETRALGLGPGDFDDDEGSDYDPDERARGQQQDDDTLPKEFPGQAALAKAGITRRSDLAGLSKEELTGIGGIGEKTAEQIVEALKS